jgi:hypothetical protein
VGAMGQGQHKHALTGKQHAAGPAPVPLYHLVHAAGCAQLAIEVTRVLVPPPAGDTGGRVPQPRA